jgi:hypothetical protein
MTNKMPERTAASPDLAPVCVGCVGDGFNPDGGPCLRCNGTGIDPDPLAPIGIEVPS